MCRRGLAFIGGVLVVVVCVLISSCSGGKNRPSGLISADAKPKHRFSISRFANSPNLAGCGKTASEAEFPVLISCQ